MFPHELDRLRRHHDGEDSGPVHPFIVALRTATNLDAMMAEQGTFIGTLLGEDGTMRGVRGRPSHPGAGTKRGRCARERMAQNAAAVWAPRMSVEWARGSLGAETEQEPEGKLDDRCLTVVGDHGHRKGGMAR